MTKMGKNEVSKSGGFSVAGGLIDTVIEIGQERARIMEAMRAALLRGDDAEALERARADGRSAQEESDESRT
jgi:hypothetical protein